MKKVTEPWKNKGMSVFFKNRKGELRENKMQINKAKNNMVYTTRKLANKKHELFIKEMHATKKEPLAGFTKSEIRCSFFLSLS
jgi:hypothetical protein